MVISLALDGDDLTQWFGALVDKIDRVAEQVVEEAVEYGADAVREIIQSSGTGNSWDESWDSFSHATVGRYSSAPGRVASGLMGQSVGDTVDTVPGQIVVGSFGWLGESVPDYFLAQEGGFTHNITGQQVEGMYAIADGGDLAYNYLDNRLGVALRDL